MADWEHEPSKPARITREAAPVLITRFEDGTETRRQKHSNITRHLEHEYDDTLANAKTKLDFAETKGLLTTFTMFTWDPSATTPSTDTANVRLEEMPSSEYLGPNLIRTRWRFVEVF